MGNKASNGKLNTVSDPALLSQIPSAPIEEPSAVIVGEHDAVPVGNIAVTGRARDGDGDAPTAATEIDLFDEKVDLDAILDESLFEAAVGEELFPVCGDCSCCKGYVFACKCSHSSVERVKCTQCRDRFKHSGYAAGAWTQGTVAAATSAISSRLTPTLSRAPSARAQSDLLAASESDPGERNWSVRIYPQLQGMPPQLCRMLVVPVVVNILSRSEHGSSLSWPDRGWAQQTDFDMEMEAAFNQNSIESSGVIIARALPRAEATFIAAKLAGLSLHASLVNERAPRLVSGVGDPPDIAHLDIPSSPGPVPDLASLDSIKGITVSPTDKYFHVAVFLREDAPSTDSTGFSDYVDSFLRSSAEIFLRVLGAPDPDNGHSAAYSWPERGWALAQHFNLHTQATMRRYGQCVVARRLSFHEAFVVHKRLEESGFRSAVLLLGNDESVSHISLQCTNGHPLLHGNNPSQRAPWRLNCDNCRCEVSDATVFSCRACDEDLCRLCACTAHGSPCRVVIGFGVGEAIPYPPDDAENAAVTAGLPDLSNLLSHLLIGSSHNSKPGTKQSVIDALETKIIGSGDMFENVDSTCVICLSDFKPGDKVTQLSCNHCFHIGDHKEFGATELQCEGIIPWLKKNNDCPMCRCQFDTEVTDEASDAGTRWCCPGCREERTQFSCERCGIRQNVTTVASGLASSLFDEVEELFFECMELHRNRTEVACSMAFAAEQQRLTAKLSDILGSEIMQTLIASNWQIKAGVKSLLEGAINGRTNFTINFDGQMLDVGSMALYSILIDRLQAKITERNFEAVLERPNLAELYGRTEWTCPLCATSNGCNAEQCSTCRTNYFVIQLSRSPDVREVFREGLEYFFEGMDIITSTVLDETGRNSAIHILKAKADVFLSSDAIQRLENLRWALRLPLAYLFAELFAAKRVLSFHVPNWSDINSCAIYASFVRQIIAKQKTDISIKPEYATITITPPSVRLDLIDEYESFESQKFSVTDNTKRFLLANKRILIDIAKKIYEGFDGADWAAITDVVIPQFAQSGWILASAVRLLKRGVRDLTTITDGLDGGSAAVIEAMLRVILRHEALTVITSMPPTSGLDADILPELGPPLHRQISLGTSARNSMERLRDRLADDAMYKKILKFLIKTLQNIQSDQSNIEYRRIIKESKAVIDMVISNPEVVSVLLSVGFVEEEHLFRLVRLHRDGIIRGVNVLRDLAAEVGIELLY